MEHNYHRERIVLHAFDTTVCKVCGDPISTGHIPGNVVCVRCSVADVLCEVCGEPMYDGERVTLEDGSWYFVEEDRAQQEFIKSLYKR